MADAKTKGPKWVQPVVDYAGLIAFVGAYVITRDLMKASWGLAIGSAAGLAAGLIFQKRIAPLPAFTGGSAVLFASLALIFHDTIFIKIKLTIIDALLAAALLGGLAMGKAPLKAMLGDALKLTDATWRKLTVRYALFFLLLAIANEIIWRNAGEGKLWTEGMWVAFRFPGVPILAVLFSLSQTPMMMKDMAAVEAGGEDPPIPPAD